MLNIDAVELTKIEADVVVVGMSENGLITIIPFWECDATGTALTQTATQALLHMAEKVNGGAIVGKVFDFRVK